MPLNNLGLGFLFSARDQATGTIRRVGTAFDRQATRARLANKAVQAAAVGIAGGIGMLAGGLAALRGSFNIASEAGRFGQTIARIGAVTQASATDLGRLRDRAIDAGIATQFSPDQAAQGLNELAVRGFQAQESMTALGGSLDLAAGGSITVANASQAMGSAIRVFGLQAGEATFVADRMLRITNLTSLQANDLAIAMGNVSRGAVAANQGLNEMLPAIGLVRNTGVEASVAANSVSSAIQFMARRGEDFQRLGVEVTNASGEFRPFLDIVLDAERALGERYPDAAQRGAQAQRLFGRFGVSAFQAITRQVRTGIRDSEGNIARGADAVNVLREAMSGARGTAARFRDQLLDTFEGQRVLLQGTVQTLRTVFGEAFGRVFRPFVLGLTTTLNAIIRVFNALPTAARTGIAALLVAIAGIVASGGALTAIGFAIALLIPFIKVVAITMGILLLAMLPVIAAAGAFAAGFIAVGLAIKNNIGGVGDFFMKKVKQVRLVWRALTELFTRGGFSRAVRSELGDRSNRGIREFVVNVFAVGHRITRFFSGIRKGFMQMMGRMAPVGERFVEALRRLGAAFGFVGEGLDDVAGTPSQNFMDVGVRIGEIVGRALEYIIRGVTLLVDWWTALVKAGKWLKGVLEPIWGALSSAMTSLGEAFNQAGDRINELTGSTETNQGALALLGKILVGVLVPAIYTWSGILIGVIWAVNGVIRAVTWLSEVGESAAGWVLDMAANFVSGWDTMRDQVRLGVAYITQQLSKLAQHVPAPLRGVLGIEGLAQAEALATDQLRGAATRINANFAQRRAEYAAVGPATAAQRGRVAERRAESREANQAMIGEMRRQFEAMGRRPEAPINIQIDGETVARAVRRGDQTNTANTFGMTPGFAEE
jgi:TP901 family phage tail tape measure protein